MLEVIAESLPFGWGKTASSATDVLQSQKTLESACARADSFGHVAKTAWAPHFRATPSVCFMFSYTT